MAPSRGVCLIRDRRIINRSFAACSGISYARRNLSSFSERLANPAHKVQSYLSRSHDPYLNLSIEDHILRTSPPDSTVLFIYTNRPCIVIGRNQNPWLEVNLQILNAVRGRDGPGDTEPPAIGTVDLVRRRSGGGTVFHDEGNLNWSVTCPRLEFTRDKHAEMVVQALRRLGVDRARVNERHDIVLDQGHEKRASDPLDTHKTAYTLESGLLPKPLKVSGSAYKLTRARALHHATTLLESPNLHIIPHYLHSPARNFIQAKGVESVSSPVGNIGLDMSTFRQRLQQEFALMYGENNKIAVVETVGEEHLSIPEIEKGYRELQTEDWIWSQTPQFDLTLDSSDGIGIEMNVHHGVIKSARFQGDLPPVDIIKKLQATLIGRKLQDIGDWDGFLRHQIVPWHEKCSKISDRLTHFLPTPKFSTSQDS